MTSMTAVYDLARCPPTYDVIAFLSLLELERKRRGVDTIDLHILPGPNGGFRADSTWPRNIPQREQLLNNVLIPICRLLPSVTSVKVSDRLQQLFYDAYGFNQYLISLPNYVEALKAGSRPLRILPQMPRQANLITITLREAEHWPLRNSQVQEWIKVGRALEDRGWWVVFIRDTCKVGEPLPEPLQQSTKAARSLNERAYLYSASHVNLGINNGPMWMAIAQDAPVLMLRPVTDAAGGCFDTSFFKRCGINKGEQLPTSPPYQRLVWEDDTAENILRAFDSMVEAL